MGGFFGTISVKDCVNDIFYGTDYNSHLGTKRAGMVTFDSERGFSRSIHSLERSYFRTKFEDELGQFHGNQGIGVISDTDPQPIIVNSHLRRYAVVTVAKINNVREIADKLLAEGKTIPYIITTDTSLKDRAVTAMPASINKNWSARRIALEKVLEAKNTKPVKVTLE